MPASLEHQKKIAELIGLDRVQEFQYGSGWEASPEQIDFYLVEELEWLEDGVGSSHSELTEQLEERGVRVAGRLRSLCRRGIVKKVPASRYRVGVHRPGAQAERPGVGAYGEGSPEAGSLRTRYDPGLVGPPPGLIVFFYQGVGRRNESVRRSARAGRLRSWKGDCPRPSKRVGYVV